jgi:hypothetical protein
VCVCVCVCVCVIVRVFVANLEEGEGVRRARKAREGQERRG